MLKVGDKITPLCDHKINGKVVVKQDEIYEILDIEHFKYTDEYAVIVSIDGTTKSRFGLMRDEVVKVKHEVVE